MIESSCGRSERSWGPTRFREPGRAERPGRPGSREQIPRKQSADSEAWGEDRPAVVDSFGGDPRAGLLSRRKWKTLEILLHSSIYQGPPWAQKRGGYWGHT